MYLPVFVNNTVFYVHISDCHPGPADVVFLIDSSQSNIAEFNKSRDSVIKVIGRLPMHPDDFRVSVVTFASDVNVEFLFTDFTSNETLINAVDSIVPSSGATFTTAALEKAEEVYVDSLVSIYRKSNCSGFL